MDGSGEVGHVEDAHRGIGDPSIDLVEFVVHEQVPPVFGKPARVNVTYRRIGRGTHQLRIGRVGEIPSLEGVLVEVDQDIAVVTGTIATQGLQAVSTERNGVVAVASPRFDRQVGMQRICQAEGAEGTVAEAPRAAEHVEQRRAVFVCRCAECVVDVADEHVVQARLRHPHARTGYPIRQAGEIHNRQSPASVDAHVRIGPPPIGRRVVSLEHLDIAPDRRDGPGHGRPRTARSDR